MLFVNENGAWWHALAVSFVGNHGTALYALPVAGLNPRFIPKLSQG